MSLKLIGHLWSHRQESLVIAFEEQEEASQKRPETPLVTVDIEDSDDDNPFINPDALEESLALANTETHNVISFSPAPERIQEPLPVPHNEARACRTVQAKCVLSLQLIRP